MTGGTYDVNQQLTIDYKVHLNWDNENPTAAVPLHGWEIKEWKKYYPNIILPEETINLSSIYVAFIEYDDNYTPSNAIIRHLGNRETKLYGVSGDRDQSYAFGVEPRIGHFEYSDFVIVAKGGKRFAEKIREKATDLRTMFVSGQNFVLGGSTDWSENPHGLSISGGVGYSAIFDPAANKVSDLKLEGAFNSPRSEIRQIFKQGKKLCFAGMSKGPDTHAADGDVSRMTGDGVIVCR
jgi:hypothetical protein